MDAGFGPRSHGVGGSPAADQARIDGEPTVQIQKSVDRQRLVRDFKDGRSPVRITAPRVGRLACTFRNIWPEPLRDTVTSPPGPPGSELMAARAPGKTCARVREAEGGAQLLIGREHEGHGAIDQAEPLQGPRREQVGHKPRLHVGHAGPVARSPLS